MTAPVTEEPVGTERVTFLFTDIEGSTELWEERPAKMRAALARHDVLLGTSISENGGAVFKKTGDGMCAAFADPGAALRAASSGQRAITAEHWGEAVIQVRIAVYTGEAERVEGDWIGRPLNRCARLLGAAHAGQVLLDEATADLARSEANVTFVDLGRYRLRGIAAPERVLQASIDGLPDRFPPLRAAPPLGDGGLVGREREMARLEAVWEAVTRGEGRGVIVAGDAGIGKTALARELIARVERAGGVVLEGKADGRLDVGYEPVLGPLGRRLAKTADATLATAHPELVTELAAILPELGVRLGPLPASRPGEPTAARARLFEGVSAILGAIAGAEGSALVIVEDVHSASLATVLLLRRLLRAPPPHVLLLVTYRHTDPDPSGELVELVSDAKVWHGVEHMVLGGIDQSAVATLTRRSRGRRDDTDDALSGLLHAETDGNPFFVRELLRQLADTGDLFKDAGRWSENSVLGLDMPGSVTEVVRRRLARLSRPVRRVMSIASVIGPSFNLALLESIAESPAGSEELLEALDEAVEARVVREDEPGRFVFAHGLFRRVLEHDMTAVRRCRLHRRVGEALERLGPDQVGPTVLAHHFIEGARDGASDKGARYALAGGRQATDQTAFEGAVGLFERGLDALAVGASDPELRAQLLLALGETWWRLFDYQRMRARALEAAETAREAGSPGLLAEAAVLFARGSIVGQPQDVTISLCREALATLPPGDARRPKVLAALAFTHAASCDMAEARPLATEALATAGRVGHGETQVFAAFGMCVVNVGSADVEELERRACDLLALGEQFEDWFASVHGLRFRADARLARGDVAGFDSDAAALGALAGEHRSSFAGAWVAQWRTMRLMLEGGFEEAERSANEMLQVFAGHPSIVTSYGLQLSYLRYEQGRLAELKALRAAYGAALSSPALREAMQLVGAFVAAGTDDREAARADLHAVASSLGGLSEGWPYVASLFLLAFLTVELDEVGLVPTVAALLRPYAGQLLIGGEGTLCLAAADRMLGQLDLLTGDLDGAVKKLESGLALERRAGAGPLVARSALALSRALERRDGERDRARAEGLRAEAAGLAARFGMAALAATATS